MTPEEEKAKLEQLNDPSRGSDLAKKLARLDQRGHGRRRESA
jgi:hypothetical protein